VSRKILAKGLEGYEEKSGNRRAKHQGLTPVDVRFLVRKSVLQYAIVLGYSHSYYSARAARPGPKSRNAEEGAETTGEDQSGFNRKL
jgi:hypothetical protein